MDIDINMAIDVTSVIAVIISWEIGKIIGQKIKKKIIENNKKQSEILNDN